ncbi:MAG: hypothetical protein RIT04_400 [Candidatus Parcubacteria bacterium]
MSVLYDRPLLVSYWTRDSAIFVRAGRIELPSHPWQGCVLPLNHARIRYNNVQDYSVPFYFLLLTGAPGGIRTPNNGSEDRYDIHFTTGAYEHHTRQYAKIKSYTTMHP